MKLNELKELAHGNFTIEEILNAYMETDSTNDMLNKLEDNHRSTLEFWSAMNHMLLSDMFDLISGSLKETAKFEIDKIYNPTRILPHTDIEHLVSCKLELPGDIVLVLHWSIED